ncbi:MAG TPA: copper chaperone PCu(A)C [Micromonosporaceae bacterium]
MVWALSGCGADDAPQAAQVSPPTGGLTVRDPWVKAADQGMTAAFAVLVNSGPRDVTVVGAASDVSESVELHEMAMQDGGMVMREKPGGLTVPAGGEYRLEPGGDHLMLMGLDRPVQAGDQITLTLTLSDGTTVEFSAVAKPFTGAQESYQPGHGTGSMGD